MTDDERDQRDKRLRRKVELINQGFSYIDPTCPYIKRQLELLPLREAIRKASLERRRLVEEAIKSQTAK